MSMPAIQLYRKRHPDAQVSLLVKPAVAPLWGMHRTPDRLHILREGLIGSLQTALDIRRMKYDTAFILPHSFRSALIPHLAGIPQRIGMPGHGRDFLLTRVVHPRPTPERRHQSFEYIDLLFDGMEAPNPETPDIAFSVRTLKKARALVESIPRPLLVVMPGAARGPSKRWPLQSFAAVARMLIQNRGFNVVVLGGKSESGLGRETAEAIGDRVFNLTGHTTLEESAAILSLANLVVANDSGGMHLAAAVGTPVVAVFGATDPSKTGPLGKCRVVQHPGLKSRDIGRASPEALKSLAAIAPEQVYEAALEALAGNFTS